MSATSIGELLRETTKFRADSAQRRAKLWKALYYAKREDCQALQRELDEVKCELAIAKQKLFFLGD